MSGSLDSMCRKDLVIDAIITLSLNIHQLRINFNQGYDGASLEHGQSRLIYLNNFSNYVLFKKLNKR